ncbi:glycoside hydrolase domain-containing protein [Pedobacter cryoconitis]|uniref:Glycoside hydrolase 123-like N-terminal domain-containing protein n=1 Tax=Pedobacter cryoconitis TaxID=188932 RepID=A0A327SD80_9SPHI|nr:glycoside hydrolase domain-containing protein [Pedobacter cryoconitis]RAJ27036.1 hypothetical protein LY11_03613 [Pedobacter cryoconitis]
MFKLTEVNFFSKAIFGVALLFSINCTLSQAQQLKYKTGTETWNPDSLGNHRAVVKVSSAGAVAKTVVEWRRKDDPANKEIIVVDARSNQRIWNVKTQALTRETGTIYFEPVSGAGTYYIYYLPFHVQPGSNYPTAVYKKPSDRATSAWKNKISGKTIAAKVDYLESYNQLNSFYPMEVIATAKEVASLVSKNKSQPYLVFPEDRLHPVKMEKDLPQRWALKGTALNFTDTADRGENFSFQLGLYAFSKDLHQVTLKFTDLKSIDGAIIPSSLLSCLNTDGINWDNQVLKKQVDVTKGEIQSLWCLLDIPEDTKPATYSGTVTVMTEGNAAVPIQLKLVISPKKAVNGGVNEPWKQTRLTWLNSTSGQKNELIKPYIPLKINTNTISLLGRKVMLGDDGMPAQIESFFTEEMTGIDQRPRPLLAAPFALIAEEATGSVIQWKTRKPEIKQLTPGEVEWTALNTSPKLKMEVKASLEFDGFINYTIKLTALTALKLKDIRMVIPFKKEVAEYMMGLNLKGGKIPADYKWKWDVAHKNQDGAWIGAVNAGLRFSLRDERYTRPLNTNFYLDKPLVLPGSWGNQDQGGIDIQQQATRTAVTNYSGAREMKAGDTLYYNFNLMITPFHTLNTADQWATRYYHKYAPVDTIKATGATVINIHHGTAINPYINYPFIAHQAMKSYIDSAHHLGLKVKIYNTVREVSNSAYELAPLRSLGHEVFSKGKGGGYAWLQEHLNADYIAAWYVPEVKDAAIINSGMSRWHNYYVEGMSWLVQNVGIDGIYLDDVAYDRTTMKRIKRVLTQNGHPGIIDLHSANQYNKRDGFNNSANLYMDHFPYLNRLWFGENFDYENNTQDFYLTEISGIPFGLMGEMLEGGGNPWRGMVYGMTNRMPWSANADPRPIWKIWDSFDLQHSRMIGYWVKSNPVKITAANVLATVYLKDKKALIAVASWAKEDMKVKLQLDWKALGIDPKKAKLKAPAIRNFQPAGSYAVNEEILVKKGEGLLLVLE